jgi:hypothetical protein
MLMPALSPGQPGDTVTLTNEGDAQRYADDVAMAVLGIPSQEAFARLDRGELAGTLAGSDLRMLRTLIAK